MNTTPVVGLSLIGQLDILKQQFGGVLIPPAVKEEVLAGGPPAAAV
jgi:predicted nucleic acid-binding protein